MTGTHKQLSDALRRHGIWHRNEVRLRATDWEYAYVADIYIRNRRTVVEVDGHSHDGREWRDRVRDARFRRDLGIRTIGSRTQMWNKMPIALLVNSIVYRAIGDGTDDTLEYWLFSGR